jgi:hypothetical protein
MSKSYGNLSGSSDDKENYGAAKLEGSLSVDILEAMAKENEKISVKERTKTFNRMASETDVGGSSVSLGGSMSNLSQKFAAAAAGQSAVKRRNSRAVDVMMGGVRRASASSSVGRGGGGDDDATHDSASITTIDPVIKSWMVHVSRGGCARLFFGSMLFVYFFAFFVQFFGRCNDSAESYQKKIACKDFSNCQKLNNEPSTS